MMAHALKPFFIFRRKRTSPFQSPGASVQSTAGGRGVRNSVSNAGHTTFQGSVRVVATQSIRQFPLHFPSRASPCAIRFQTHSNSYHRQHFIFTLQLTGQYFIRHRHYTQYNHHYYFNTFIT